MWSNFCGFREHLCDGKSLPAPAFHRRLAPLGETVRPGVHGLARRTSGDNRHRLCAHQRAISEGWRRLRGPMVYGSNCQIYERLVVCCWNSPFYSLMILMFLMDLVVKGQFHGITRTEGEEWQQMKRFTLHAMRNLGMGRSRMENEVCLPFRTKASDPNGKSHYF